jgi:tetratricopeptide (TPR) repeat protein
VSILTVPDDTQSEIDFEAGYRYRAFISYSHADKRWAQWLHHAIESYKPPKKLSEALVKNGRKLAKLTPVFMDRAELASSADLAATVRDALQDSDYLIVICSPRSARSRWVNEEIRTFHALARSDRILCLIVDGEPHATTRSGFSPDVECFPPALRVDDTTGQERPEPLGADVRATGDGRTPAKLKIIATLLGVPFDQLRQREQARRQRQLVAISILSSIGFLIMAGLTVAAVVARHEAETQRAIAEQKTRTAERTTQFLTSLFRVSDPSEARGNTITAREILDRGAQQIKNDLREEPSVRADLMVTLGEVYTGLGLYAPGRTLLSSAARLDGVEKGTRVRQSIALAEVRFQQGEYEQARDLYKKAIADIREGKRIDPQQMARALRGLGDSLSALEDFTDARLLFTHARKILPSSHPDQALTLEAIGTNEFYAGDYAASIEALQLALKKRTASVGRFHPAVSQTLNLLGAIAYMQGDRKTATTYYAQTLEIDQRVLGDTHPAVALTKNNLARVYLEQSDFKRAYPLLTKAYEITLKQRGPDHDDLAFVLGNLALAEKGLGRTQRAITHFERALSIAQLHSHRMRGPMMTDLAALECETGDATGGLARATAALPILADDYPEESWRPALAQTVRAQCLIALNRVAEARTAATGVLPIIAKKWPENTLFGAEARARLALLGKL